MFRSRWLRVLLPVFVVGAVCMAATGAGGPRRQAVAGPLQLLPADTLFCVRVNNLEATGDALTAYLQGLIGEDDNVKEAIVKKLAEAFGQEQLQAVRMTGSFALFGLNLPVEGQNMNPFAGLFVGALLPVTNYENFVSRNANVGEPGDDGVCEIKIDGGVRGLATSVRRFALVSHNADRAKFLKAREVLSQRENRLAGALDEQERELARKPLWAYGNARQASRIVGPMIFMGLEGMKMQLRQMQQQGQGPMVGNVDGIIDFYSAIINVIMEGTDRVSLAAEPSSEMCRFTFTSRAVDGTLLDELMVAPPQAEIGSLGGYLDDGAMFNMITRIGKPGLRTAYVKMIDLLIKITGEKISPEDAEKLRSLTVKAIDSLGDAAAFSFKAGSPFAAKSVMRIEDEQAYKSVMAESLKMMADGTFDKLYSAFGLNMRLGAEATDSEYRGAKVGKAVMRFSMGDADSKENKAMQKILGDGIEYSWAVTDGYAVDYMGQGSGEGVRKLIDQVKAGGPGEPGPELMQAHDVFMADRQEEPQYDFAGTLNIVRLMNMMVGFMGATTGQEVEPMALESRHNVVFAGKCADGALMVETVVPRAHLLEIKQAGKKIDKVVQQAATAQGGNR